MLHVEVSPLRVQVTAPPPLVPGQVNVVLLNCQKSSVDAIWMSSVATALTVIVLSCGSVAPFDGEVIMMLGGLGSFGGGGGGMPLLVPSLSVMTWTLFCVGRLHSHWRAENSPHCAS